MPEDRIIPQDCDDAVSPRFLADVKAFHDACDIPTAPTPRLPAMARQELRAKLIREETTETLEAIATGNIAKIADGIADSIYVLMGTALEYGLPIHEVWRAVQQANMAKVDAETGKVIRRADGKILKPEGWQEPNVSAILMNRMPEV